MAESSMQVGFHRMHRPAKVHMQLSGGDLEVWHIYCGGECKSATDLLYTETKLKENQQTSENIWWDGYCLKWQVTAFIEMFQINLAIRMYRQAPDLSLGKNASYVMIMVLYLYIPHFPEAEVCHLFLC